MKNYDKKILICGGRDYYDYEELDRFLSTAYYDFCEGVDPEKVLVIHGNANGADKLGGMWAKYLGFDVQIFPAKWDIYGESAGRIRNQLMLDQHPDIIFALPGGAGTNHMIKIAIENGIEVIQYGKD